jgi:LysM repeat protein
MPSRDHRCAAFSPPAPLSPEKQSRLCLTPAHLTCATYGASLAAREVRLGAAPTERATRWGLARTTTVIEDPGGWTARVLALLLDRRRWPAIPAVLLVTTLFTLALSGFRAGGSTTAVATTSPSVPSSTAASTARPTAASNETVAPQATAAATAPAPSAATATPQPTAGVTTAPTKGPTLRKYTVRSGDTLSGIATSFGTTPRAIAALNGISVGTTLHIGQVLKIPS